MIYVTGDTHGDRGYFQPECAYCRDPGWKAGDKVIVTGDFGFVMLGEHRNQAEKEKLDYLAEKPYEILFIDGNHEGFPSLREYPEDCRYGGPVRRIRDNIFWLQRGHIYTIEGKTFLALGGAATPYFDIPNKMAQGKWFPEEIPSWEEMQQAKATLAAADYRVDYILSHTAPLRLLPQLLGYGSHTGEADTRMEDFLEMDICRKDSYPWDRSLRTAYRNWFFGHFHQDREFYDGLIACMDEVHML